jgi:putative solute:sodium symporter small subunit
MRKQPAPANLHDEDAGTERLKISASMLATTALLSIWGLVAVGSFLVDDTLSPRFLDLPLGAFLAGQGALMGLVIVGIRVARADLEGREH